MKATQLSYPTPAQFETAFEAAAQAAPSALANIKLVSNQPRNELHHLRDGAIVLYRRERSKVWQMRFKLYDRKWHSCLLYTSPSPRDRQKSRMPSSA